MSSREERLARNEVLFRSVNERIAELANDQLEDVLHILCECARVGCETMITVPVDDYDRVRKHQRRFLLKPGHADPAIEDVVERHEEYDIVQKHADVAVQAGI